jgi:hypothetical protein
MLINIHVCKLCGAEQKYTYRSNYLRAEKENRLCKLCIAKNEERRNKIKNLHIGKKHSKDTCEKISLSKIGHSVGEETRVKISKTQIGKKHTLETKLKMSISRCKYLHENGGIKQVRLSTIHMIQNRKLNGTQLYPNYNPNACKIINEYGNNNNYNFQHAENGGEYYIKELGYWVDGYDKEKNVIIEIDEPRHYNSDGRLKERDANRQKEIQDLLNCIFIRIKIGKENDN